jgi:hypothetical protein
MELIRSGSRALTEVDISRLARELARGLQPLELVLQHAGITSEAFDRLKDNAIFQTRMVEEAQLWSATTKQSIQDRVATKAAAMVEELLVDAVEIVQNPDIPGAARVQALQFIAKLGHLGEGPVTRDDGSGRVSINIMIGNQKVSFDKETSSDSSLIEGEVLTQGISEHP